MLLSSLTSAYMYSSKVMTSTQVDLIMTPVNSTPIQAVSLARARFAPSQQPQRMENRRVGCHEPWLPFRVE